MPSKTGAKNRAKVATSGRPRVAPNSMVSGATWDRWWIHMRLLFLSPTFPYPPTNGHKMRTWAMLCALAAEGHHFTVLTFAEPQEAKADCRPLFEISKDIEIEIFKPAAL